MLWFVLPVGLVAINDTTALAFGKAFGRKIFASSLVSVSPKKTWEGFLGAAVSTITAGFYLPLVLQSRRLLCSFIELQMHEDVDPNDWTCEALYLTETEEWKMLGLAFTACPLQIHGLALGLFASIVAPFGGFFASALKRAYGLKDFDGLIPGHGGVMDRFDCQFIMALFVYVYKSTFLTAISLGVDGLLMTIVGMDNLDQQQLVEKLMALGIIPSCHDE